jgi:hypothetical protein
MCKWETEEDSRESRKPGEDAADAGAWHGAVGEKEKEWIPTGRRQQKALTSLLRQGLGVAVRTVLQRRVGVPVIFAPLPRAVAGRFKGHDGGCGGRYHHSPDAAR